MMFNKQLFSFGITSGIKSIMFNKYGEPLKSANLMKLLSFSYYLIHKENMIIIFRGHKKV